MSDLGFWVIFLFFCKVNYHETDAIRHCGVEAFGGSCEGVVRCGAFIGAFSGALSYTVHDVITVRSGR